MEYFSTFLLTLCLSTLILSHFSLLDFKGWVVVLLTFSSLIVVQRSHVHQAKEQEKADMIHKIQQFQKMQQEKHELMEWRRRKFEQLYGGKTDPSGDIFVEYSNLFGVTAKVEEAMLNDLESKRIRWKQLKDRNISKMEKLYKKLDVEMAYNSNAIEGNTITRLETEKILGGGSIGLSSKEVDIIKGHSNGFKHIRKILLRDTDDKILTMEDILDIHNLVTCNSESSGRFRRGDEHGPLGYQKIVYPLPFEIENLIKRVLVWIHEQTSTGQQHPFLLAVTLHYLFIRIHPFPNGNGQTSRLISNLVLMKFGFPPIIVPVDRAGDYLRSLASWNDGDSGPFTKLMVELLDRMFIWCETELIC